MKLAVPRLAAVFAVVIALVSVPATGATLEQTYSQDTIKIEKAGPFDRDKQVVINTGEKVTFEIKVFEDEFFGDPIINANAKITNNMKQKVRGVYAIAFFDKDDKLIGCHQGSWQMEPGEDINYGSGIIRCDSESIAKVTSYKLRTFVLEAGEE